MGNLQTLMADTLDQLQAPIQEYYDALDNTATNTPLGKIRMGAARAIVYVKYRRALARAIDAAALLAVGDAMTGAQRAEIIYAKNEQDQYAQGFLDSLPKLTVDQALARAASYLPSILQIYSALQIHDVPTLPIEPGDGQTYCGHWCKCTLDVRKAEQDFDIYWTLHPAEHCEDCLKMAALWKPLRIRNGVIIDKYDYSFLSSKERKMLVQKLSALLAESGINALQN